jgi:hypothetical protein
MKKNLDQIKDNDDEENYYRRLVREINNGLIDIKTVRASTIKKYKIKFDEKTNKYISE